MTLPARRRSARPSVSISPASDVADSKASLILDQVTNGVAVRMAVLYLLLGGGREE